MTRSSARQPGACCTRYCFGRSQENNIYIPPSFRRTFSLPFFVNQSTSREEGTPGRDSPLVRLRLSAGASRGSQPRVSPCQGRTPECDKKTPGGRGTYLDGIAARLERHPIVVEESDLFLGFSVSVGQEVLLQRRQLGWGERGGDPTSKNGTG